MVYNHFTAFSAADKTYTGQTPFSIDGASFSCNRSYEYLLQHCEKKGLRAAFTTTDDIIGPGLFNSVWILDKKWKRQIQPAYTRLIFDKFSPLAYQYIEQSDLLTSNPGEVHFFHSRRIRSLFDNKLRTYKSFPDYTVPTVKINLLSEKTINIAQKKLQRLVSLSNHPDDFKETFVLKDKYGYAGINVFKIENNKELSIIGQRKKKKISFVLQPFVEAAGFEFDNYQGNIDLRVIVCNGEIVQSYIRIPKDGDFRANASQGGQLVYLTTEQIPSDVVKMSKAIEKELPIQNSFYSLDYIKSSTGHLYLIEGNTTPGINWFEEKNEIRAKQLMRLIVQKLKQQTQASSYSPTA